MRCGSEMVQRSINVIGVARILSAVHFLSFKVTNFGTNRKLICNFLLVINSNLLPILHRVRDIALERSKIAIFGYPSLV